MLLLSADLCLGFTAVKLGILPDFFHTQYEDKLIDHLAPFTNLLPIYTRKTSQCLWRKLISKISLNATFVAHSVSGDFFVKRLVCRFFWFKLHFITNKGRQSFFQQLAIAQIWTGVTAKVLFEIVYRHLCIFLMDIQKMTILSTLSDRKMRACTLVSWFGLFLSNGLTDNHEHSFISYLWYFFPPPLHFDSLLGRPKQFYFFPKGFTSCFLCCLVRFLRAGLFTSSGLDADD